MKKNTVVYVLVGTYQGDMSFTEAYSSIEKLAASRLEFIISELGAESINPYGDFDTVWAELCALMVESEWAFDISECAVDGPTLYTI